MKFTKNGSLLLVLQVSLYEDNGQIYFEDQACHGAEMWAQYFDSVIIACSKMSKEEALRDTTIVWKPITNIPSIHRIRFVELPRTYTIKGFLENQKSVRKVLRELINESEFLQFAVGGILGDWASVAGCEALAMDRAYTVHMDWIAHNVMLQSLDKDVSWYKKFKRSVRSKLTCWWNNRVIAKAAAALCNGKTCYDYYRTINKHAFLIHDIHVGVESLASSELIQKKKAHVSSKNELMISYAGRLDPMKDPLSWLKALAHARDSGVKFKATWYGEGPIKADFLQEIERLKLNNQVIAPGYVNDRHILLENIRKSDIFLMTHVTDESPRCIIESLFCATPVFGYSSSYAIDVLGIKPAGILVPAGDWKALGESIVNINKERHLLADLIGLAGIRGEKFTDEQVFEERAKIIKRSH